MISNANVYWFWVNSLVPVVCIAFDIEMVIISREWHMLTPIVNGKSVESPKHSWPRISIHLWVAFKVWRRLWWHFKNLFVLLNEKKIIKRDNMLHGIASCHKGVRALFRLYARTFVGNLNTMTMIINVTGNYNLLRDCCRFCTSSPWKLCN